MEIENKIQIKNFFKVSQGCIGQSSSSLDYFPLSSNVISKGRSRALATLNYNRDMRVSKFQRSDFGIYKAEELRNLATLYPFLEYVPHTSVKNGGSLNCKFDNLETEKCAWYPVPLGGINGHLQRGRFESFFEIEKFDCTSDRTFSLGKLIFSFLNFSNI